jgi:signal transduction histidine kinase/ActR/RegA family two-component response regulator
MHIISNYGNAPPNSDSIGISFVGIFSCLPRYPHEAGAGSNFSTLRCHESGACTAERQPVSGGMSEPDSASVREGFCDAEVSRAIFDALPANIAVLDPEGIILAVNEAWRRSAQDNALADPAAGVGQNYLCVCDQAQGEFADQARTAADGIRAVLSGESPDFTLEYACHSPGRERWFRLVARPIATGQVKGAVVVHVDITVQRQAEAQFFRAQRLESLGTLAGGIAHELNNVLAPMLLAVEALQAKATDPEDREFLELLEQSAQRGAAIVRQVLSFARGVEGRRAQIHPRELLHELEKILSTTLKQIQIHLRVGRDTWPLVGDATQLQQALLNLCVNARDAMPAGGTLTLSAQNVMVDEAHAAMHPDAKPGPYVLCQVIDTGTGITPGVREKIFEPFFTTKEKGKGTGLGLSTTAAIVKSHGGFISVCSEIGKGTSFSLYFPARGEAVAEPDPAHESTDLSTVNGELVLVVDDEAAIRKSTKRALQAAGYRVLLAADGSEALALYVQHQPDIAVVVTDLMMPILDGIATMRALRRLNAQARIIATTSLATKAQTIAAVEAGADDFLAKPYTARTLLLTLQRVLRAG